MVDCDHNIDQLERRYLYGAVVCKTMRGDEQHCTEQPHQRSIRDQSTHRTSPPDTSAKQSTAPLVPHIGKKWQFALCVRGAQDLEGVNVDSW
jgi:hypothetical protein